MGGVAAKTRLSTYLSLAMTPFWCQSKQEALFLFVLAMRPIDGLRGRRVSTKKRAVFCTTTVLADRKLRVNLHVDDGSRRVALQVGLNLKPEHL